MGHVGDGVGFHDGFAVSVPPDRAGIAIDRGFRHRRRRQVMHVEPLLDDLVGVRRIDGLVGAAVPHRKFRPGAFVRRCVADEIAELARRARRRLVHAAQGLLEIGGDAIGQARDDSAAREHFRIGRQHHRGHGAAGGKAGDEDTIRVDAVIARHLRDHLPDRQRFAAVARNIFRIEPVEAAIAIVRRLLLRHQQRKAVALCQPRPAGACIVTCSILGAAVQHDDQRGFLPRPLIARLIRKHPDIAWIAAESGGFGQAAACATPIEASRKAVQAFDFIQLWQAAQEFDVVGEGHGSSFVRNL